MNDFESRYLGIPCYIDTDMDIPSLYPKQRICYESMYEMERIKRTMKVGTKVTPIQPKNPELFGKIGTVVSATVEHGCGLYPTATVEVVFDGFPGSFGFNPNKLALVNVSKMEESIMKTQKNALPGIKKVIYSGNKTIILWADNTKTIVSCKEGDTFDPYMGFCAAVVKKLFGTNSNIKKTIMEKASGRDDIDIFLD